MIPTTVFLLVGRNARRQGGRVTVPNRYQRRQHRSQSHHNHRTVLLEASRGDLQLGVVGRVARIDVLGGTAPG